MFSLVLTVCGVVQWIRLTSSFCVVACLITRHSLIFTDISDIERSFDGYEDTLKGAFTGLQGVADLSRSLPAPLQSITNFQLYIVAPFLAVMLVLQLLGAYHSSRGIQDNVVATPDEASVRYLATNSTLDMASMELGSEVMKEWSLLWAAVQSYLIATLQIAIAFLMTQSRAIVALVNFNIGVLEANINSNLKAALGDCFESIFVMGFGAVKIKFLDLVHKIDLIEQPLRKVQESVPAAGLFGKFLK